jgi:hypothetical protein
MDRNCRNLLLASVLVLSSMTAFAQSAAKPGGPPPGHDMNEQNMNAPGMREHMNVQQRGASGTSPRTVTGHDMNEQNVNAPGMRERMRREDPGTKGGGPLPPSPYPLVDRYNP